jgi:hypothetical protein
MVPHRTARDGSRASRTNLGAAQARLSLVHVAPRTVVAAFELLGADHAERNAPDWVSAYVAMVEILAPTAVHDLRPAADSGGVRRKACSP